MEWQNYCKVRPVCEWRKNWQIAWRKKIILLERQEDGSVKEVTCYGAWTLCDNGHLKWSILTCPFNHTSDRKEIRFSEWLESLRKDVECTFGILKQRWRMLKSGIRLHSIESCDRMFKTCCALHNFLLEADGMDKIKLHSHEDVAAWHALSFLS